MSLHLPNRRSSESVPERNQCLVCGGPLHWCPHNETDICDRADCRQVAAQRMVMDPVAFERYLRLRVPRIRAGIAREKAVLAAQTRARKQERSENVAHWQAQLGALPECPPRLYPLTAVPSCRRKVVNLPAKRQRHFRDLLNQRISQAVLDRIRQGPSASQPAPRLLRHNDLTSLIDVICTRCAGGCCTRGANHAYLTQETLLRVMDEQPKLRPRHILETYLSHLPSKTYAESCIFHTSRGCALPRNLRSHTCSDFFCDGVKDLIAAFRNPTRPKGTVVIVRSREPWDSEAGANNHITAAFLLRIADSVDADASRIDLRELPPSPARAGRT